jgi:hypothetical protein
MQHTIDQHIIEGYNLFNNPIVVWHEFSLSKTSFPQIFSPDLGPVFQFKICPFRSLLSYHFHMMDLETTNTRLFAFIVGIILHTALYRRGEWDLAVPKLCAVYSLVGLGLASCDQLFTFEQHHRIFTTLKTVSWLGFYHALGVGSSIVVYRLFFHRLRSFPGPFWAKISNLYVTSLTFKNLQLYSEVEALHNQYGDIVRIGNWQPKSVMI